MPHTALIVVAVAPPTAPRGAARPFSKVEGREVFMRTIELYANRDEVTQKILAVSTDDLPTVQSRYAAHLAFQGVQVAAASPDWFAVVTKALEKLKPDIERVIIHDACRPAVPYTLLDALDQAMESPDHAGVAPVLPITGCLAKVANNELGPADPSATLHDIQTPQLFARPALITAYAKLGTIANPTDDAQLLRLAGHKIATIPGSPYNVRVDSDELTKLAQDYLKHLPRPRTKGPVTPFDEAQW